MDKQTILRLFLKHGAQLEPDALNLLSENQNLLEYVLQLGIKLPSVITIEFLKSLHPEIENNNKKISTTQFSQILNYRYNFIRNLLLDKPELVNLLSINKISEKTKQFSIIGTVFEKDETLTLEDTTGRTALVIDKQMAKHIVDDEVIGIVCERHTNINKVKQVVFPDIPFKKENSRIENQKKCLFISDLHMDSQKFNERYYKNFQDWLKGQKNLNIFVLGGISTTKEDTQKFLSDISESIPVFIQTKSPTTMKIDHIQILLSDWPVLQYYLNLWKEPPDTTVINLLKKRNLNPILSPTSYENSFLIETVPDIIAIGGVNQPILTNYKGTTILTTGSFLSEPIYWLINLQTRETFKIDFS